VNWGLLSNGEQYQFLRREVVNTNVSVEILTEAEVQKLPEQVPRDVCAPLLSLAKEKASLTDEKRSKGQAGLGQNSPNWLSIS